MISYDYLLSIDDPVIMYDDYLTQLTTHIGMHRRGRTKAWWLLIERSTNMNLRERGRQYEAMNNRNNRNALFGQYHNNGNQQYTGQQSAEYTRDILTEQNDNTQNELLAKARQLRSVVTVIGDEVSEHNRILGGMQDNMDKTDSLLGTTLGKLTEMGKHGGSKNLCYMVLFFLFIIFLLYWNAFRKSPV